MSRLRRAGVMGMNARNLRMIMPWNPRRFYPLVDDKLRTKSLCADAGVATPELYGVVRHHFEVRRLAQLLSDLPSFVVKPARGCQGNGVLVVVGQEQGRFVRTGGALLEIDALAFHVSEILSGLFSLGGQPDQAIVEERMLIHPALRKVSEGGVPDVRVIVYRGFPAMAMIRLPTRRSGGRANLHQGAVGVGIDLRSGRTHHAVCRERPTVVHPDTGERVIGLEVPDFDALLESAVRVGDRTGLGYVGVDLIVDERRGPVVLELNARPGLAIQLANDQGLHRSVERIDAHAGGAPSCGQRVRIGRELAQRAEAGP